MRRPLLGLLLFAACNSKPATETCNIDGGSFAPVPYLVKEPAAQGMWVLDISDETVDRQLLARTLQGVVNRRSARIYIVDDLADPETPADSTQATQFWINEYQSEFGLSMTGSGNLDDALAVFASEIDGYVLISDDEPWTINAGCTEAATQNVVVATSADSADLDAAGIHQADSLVGRWTDALSCDEELATQVGQLPFPGMAVIAQTKLRPRDFFIQQGMLVLGNYENTPEWPAVQTALSHLPQQVPLYGYPAVDAVSELTSVTDISQAGDVLIATDSTPNLSFHQAMHPKSIAHPNPPADADAACDGAELNVVIAITDGDNQVLETVLYPTSDYWLAPERGQLPISWSISPATAALAPAVYDYYARTLAPSDELVVMIGAGYAYASQMPNSAWFYGLTFEQMQSLGLRVLWLFDPIESGSGTYSWQSTAEPRMADGCIDGLLDGYYPPLIYPNAPLEQTVGSVPVIRASGQYSDVPTDIANRISALLAMPQAQRPPVVFYAAASWSNTVPALVAALKPLESQGVRFLSASGGMRCVSK